MTRFVRVSRVLAAGVLGTALVASGLWAAEPARAASTVVVNSVAELRAAASPATCDGTSSDPKVIEFGSSLGMLRDPEVMYLRCDLRIDLKGFVWNSGPIALGGGKKVTLMSSAPNARVLAYTPSSDYFRAGIRTTDAHLVIDGIRVEAMGGALSAAIGGGGRQSSSLFPTGEDGGTLHVRGGARVSASVQFSNAFGAGIGGGAAVGTGGGSLNGGGPTARGGNGGTILIEGAGTHVSASSVLGAGIGGGGGHRLQSGGGGGRGGVGAQVTIRDGAIVSASSTRGAGIGGGSGTGYGTNYAGQGGRVVVDGATVDATSNAGAGIGAGDSTDNGAHGGSLSVIGGAKATARSSSGTGYGHARQGGHGQSDGQVLEIAEGSVLTASSSSRTAVGLGEGRATVAGDLVVTSSLLTVISSRFAVTETGRVLGSSGNRTGSTRIEGNGTIDNRGVISLTNVAAATTVLGNNFPVRFIPSSGSPSTTRLYAPDFQSGFRSIPALPSGFHWNTQADGSGARLAYPTAIVPTFMSEEDHAENDGSTEIVVRQAQSLDGDAELRVDAPATAIAGEPFDVDGILVDLLSGDEAPVPGAMTLAFSPAGASVGPDGRVTATEAGELVVFAEVTHEGAHLSAQTTVEVVPAALATLTMTPDAVRVLEGGSATFDFAGADAFGNPVTVDPAGVALTSSDAGDTASGATMTFGGPGAREVTATVAGVSASADAEVIGADARYTLRIVGAPIQAVAGEVFALGAELVDELTGEGVPDHPDLAWSTSDPGAVVDELGDVIAERAGTVTVSVSMDVEGQTRTAAVTVEVVAGPLATLTLTPSASEVFEDADLDVVVTGSDAFGNAVDVSAAVLTSSDADDVIDGWSVTVTEWGARTLTASLDEVDGTTEIEVVVDPDRYVLQADPLPSEVVAGESTPVRAVVIDTADDSEVAAQPAITWTASQPDAVVSSGTLTATEAGPLGLTASATFKGLTLDDQVDTTVVAAAAAAVLRMTVSPEEVSDGGSVEVAVEAEDEFGNAVETDAVVLSSSDAADTVDGMKIRFAGAGARTITAQLGDASAEVELTVLALPEIPLAVTGMTMLPALVVAFLLLAMGFSAVRVHVAVRRSSGTAS